MKAIIPIAKKYNLKMVIHPDAPPWSIFNLPRIITNKSNFEKFLNLVDDKSIGYVNIY